jgi:hypothetical protein
MDQSCRDASRMSREMGSRVESLLPRHLRQHIVRLATAPQQTKLLLLLSLVVHPTSLCYFWHNSDASWTPRPMAATPAPDNGMPMGMPVHGGGLNGLAHVRPGFTAAPFEGQ